MSRSGTHGSDIEDEAASDDGFILSDSEEDLIMLAPPPKRLKKLKNPAPAPKTTPSRKKLPSSTDDVGKKRRKKLTPATVFKADSQNPQDALLPSHNRMDVDEPQLQDKDIGDDFDDVQWEDAEAMEGQEPAEQVPVKQPEQEHHELDIKIGAVDGEDDDTQANAKKRKREPKKRKGEPKRRGSKKEREYAVNWHNMHLLTWIGHALHMTSQVHHNTLHQALCLSLLPANLFDAMFKLANQQGIEDHDDWISEISRLLDWFHQTFQVEEPLGPTKPAARPKAQKGENATEPIDLTQNEPKPSEKPLLHDTTPSDSLTQRRTDIWRRFYPIQMLSTLYLHKSAGHLDFKPVLSQQVAYRFFSVLLAAFGLPFRTVWSLDKLVVPSKFADFTSYIPKVPFSSRQMSRRITAALMPEYPSTAAFGSSLTSSVLPPASTPIKRQAKLEIVSLPSVKSRKKLVEPSSKEDASEKHFEAPLAAPFLWFEVYSPIENRWIPIDLFRKLIDEAELWNIPTAELKSAKKAKKKRSKFGTTDCGYIIACSETGRLSHVAPRYCQSYSESLYKMGDAEWFLSFLKQWNAQVDKDDHGSSSQASSASQGIRRAMEEADKREMDEIIEKEPMPTTLDAYKSHPLYVLERDLLKFEVLRPNHSAPIHKVGEHDVYLRKDVSPIHTPDKWIQEGMQVKQGEVAVLEMIKRSYSNWDNVKGGWLDEESGAEMSQYFGDWQIETFAPPVAQNGLVPKNRYGNVYLFKPEMLPIGTVHLQGYPHLDRSVKKIGVDVAPAMVGWTIEGYWSIPQLDGWVICEDKVDIAIDAWHADAAKREADAMKKIKDRATAAWLNLTKQLLIKAKLDKIHQKGDAEENPPNTSSHTLSSKAAKASEPTSNKNAPNLASSSHSIPQAITQKATQHTHTFPQELYTTDEDGNVTRRCPCGFTDSSQRL